jgi:hypothetical protein
VSEWVSVEVMGRNVEKDSDGSELGSETSHLLYKW